MPNKKRYEDDYFDKIWTILTKLVGNHGGGTFF